MKSLLIIYFCLIENGLCGKSLTNEIHFFLSSCDLAEATVEEFRSQRGKTKLLGRYEIKITAHKCQPIRE